MRNSRLVLLGLAILCLAYGLGNHGLFEDNEARFFEISWEMAQSDDWLTPRLNFIKHFHKPPGTYWIVGSSLKAFGSSEWAGRLPIFLASLFTLGLTVYLARRFGGEGPGAEAAVLVLASTVQFWLMSRMVLTDMFLTLTVVAALVLLWELWNSHSPGPISLGFWITLGLSMLVKGPVGPAIVGLTVLGFRLQGNSPNKGWRAFRLWPGLLVFAAVALPWYLVEVQRNSGLLDYFLVFQTVDRVTTTVHGRPGPIWFYLPALLGGFFPWSVALPRAFHCAWRERHKTEVQFLLSWIVPSLILFSLAGSKLPTYLLPLYPALAILVGRTMERPGLEIGVGLGLFGLACGLWQFCGMPPELMPAEGALLALSGLACLGAALGLTFYSRGNLESYLHTCLVSQFGILLCLGFALGQVGDHYSAKQVARAVKASAYPQARVVEYSSHLHGLPFYLGRRVAHLTYPRETLFESPEDLDGYYFPMPASDFLKALGPTRRPILVMRRSDYDPQLFSEYRATPCGRHLVLTLPQSSAESLSTE